MLGTISCRGKGHCQHPISGSRKQKIIFNLNGVIDLLRDAHDIYAESPFEGKVEILNSMAQCVNFHEGRAVIDRLKPYSFLIIPGFLEEKNAVRESPFMLPR